MSLEPLFSSRRKNGRLADLILDVVGACTFYHFRFPRLIKNSFLLFGYHNTDYLKFNVIREKKLFVKDFKNFDDLSINVNKKVGG